MNQIHHFYQAHRQTSDTLQDAAFLCGLYGDNPNPLSDEEILTFATSDKPYAWAFSIIAKGKGLVS